jgi:hypothetical protein
MTADEYVAEMSADHGLGDLRCDKSLPESNTGFSQSLTSCSDYTTSSGWCGV